MKKNLVTYKGRTYYLVYKHEEESIIKDVITREMLTVNTKDTKEIDKR